MKVSNNSRAILRLPLAKKRAVVDQILMGTPIVFAMINVGVDFTGILLDEIGPENE